MALTANTKFSFTLAAAWAGGVALISALVALLYWTSTATWEVRGLVDKVDRASVKVDSTSTDVSALAGSFAAFRKEQDDREKEKAALRADYAEWRGGANFNFETLRQATGANLIPLKPAPKPEF